MKKQSLLLSIGLSVFLIAPSTYALSDIEGVAFQGEIEYLLDQGIVSGHPDGTYKPFNPINRAEFSKIVAEAAFENIDPTNTRCFPDVQEEWFAKYVCRLKEEGVIEGYPNGDFVPANNVNFAEGAKFVVNGFGLDTSTVQPGQEWYQPFINTLSDYNAIPFNLLGADQKLDRSQMAYIIYKIINPNLVPDGLKQIEHCYWPALATYDYFKDEKAVYYTAVGDYTDYGSEGFPTLAGADPATLEVVACEVLKDKENVFSLAKKMTLDGESFEMLSSQNFEFGLTYTYGKDKNGVYYFQTVDVSAIPGVNETSFEVLEEGVVKELGSSFYGFAKDKNKGYLEGAAIPGSDGESFALIGENVAYDESHIYVSKGNLLRVYENLDPTPLLKMSAEEFLNGSDSFFENVNHELYQTTEVIRASGEDLTIEWFKAG